ncbi:transcriptional regulator FtrA [Rhizobium rosettiformans]|uniref:transcriptional regulator FtrA n=1 Tax=Rhizobium rosettiformans TaxID=1368430 RepID=UPI00285F25F2|nr:transcriptional regulator FtrA [Rhizobium rosettiformans]MDR7030140.1 AraC family transcriptional activator FtrA [Rhizobium rosettiformans]MDR7065879.1 AraC family transcriptional activator FtrA [Rhizobium rosettiformans]
MRAPVSPLSTAMLTGPRVVTLAYDGLCTFEFGVAVEVFGLARPEMGNGWYRHATAAIEPGPLRAAGGLTVTAAGGLELLAEADLIVVPGWRGIDEAVPVVLVDALRAAHARGARLMSLCSGVAVLAATGLLDGRQATTHWRYAEAIGSRHPLIRLDPDVLYVDEGEILTAAGSAAGIDLCLHVVRRDFGAEAANSVARRLVVPPHREGGQAQFIVRPVPQDREGKRLGPLIDWIDRNLQREITLAEMATRAGMSARTFQRRFRDLTGNSPGEFLLARRLRHACDLLERQAALSLDDIALAAGFGTPATLRHHFRTRLATSPTAYRARFGHAN